MRDFRDQNFDGKKVILRLDLNVPLDSSRNIVDNNRILESIATINALVKMNAKVIIISHLGRPKDLNKSELSLMPIYKELQNLLPNYNIYFAPDIDKAKHISDSINSGDIIMLENIRYYSGEESGDEDFAKTLSGLGDYYINDAFSCSHRAHASVSVIAKYIDSFPGLLMKKEIESLSMIFSRSFFKKKIAIIGGGKVSSKIGLLKSLSQSMDLVMIGGAMANTFLKAKGYNIGSSNYEEEYIDFAIDIINNAQSKIILPIDSVVSVKDSQTSRHCNLSDVRPNEYIGDLGSETVNLFIKEINSSIENFSNNPKLLVVWNGPLGIVEDKRFDSSSVRMAKFIANMSLDNKLVSIAGGGDVVYAINKASVKSQFTYVSTAGGAFLEWLEGKELPGVSYLNQSANANFG